MYETLALTKSMKSGSKSSLDRPSSEMIEAGEYEYVVSKWAAEARRRWEKSKFFKLWSKERKVGRDPHKAFTARGWEP